MRLVSLFDRTGIWSDPWKAVATVERVDLSLGLNVLEWEPNGPAEVVLAAPPCGALGRLAHFCKEMTTQEGLELVNRTRQLIEEMSPSVWCIENPQGSRARIVLGPPKLMVRWSQYGFPAEKRTWLWGRFKPPIPTTPMAVPSKVIGKRGSRPASQELAKNLRDNTPHGFAQAFFEANYP